MTAYSERESRLLATMLNVLVAGMSDPSRLSRGRSYARQGAVAGLQIEPGQIAATVQGSRPTPYAVVISTRPAVDIDAFAALVPKSRDVTFDCTCPDWDVPCKHAVAVMVHFAELVGKNAGELLRWRSVEVDESPRAVVGSRRQTRSMDEPRAAEQRAAELAALGEYLGQPIDLPPAELTPLPLPRELWDEQWTTMLRSALESLTDSVR